MSVSCSHVVFAVISINKTTNHPNAKTNMNDEASGSRSLL